MYMGGSRVLAALVVFAACASPRPADSIAREPAANPPAGPGASADAGAPSGAGRYANVHGLRMYHEVRGQGPALVLLHGGTGWIEFWPEALEYFSTSYQVIAPEQMGHGRTADDPKRTFHYHDMAEDTVDLLRQLHVESAFVLGWSDGGIVGLDMAMNHPTLVKRLAVMGANAQPSGPATLDAESAKWLRDVKPEDWPFRDAYIRLSPDGAAHWPALLETRLKPMWFSEPTYTHEQLGRITSPTLVISGDHDMIRIEHTVEIFQSIPGAQLWIVPNSGHMVPKKRPQLFHETVRAFFEEAPGTHY
jgi:pimeloyl-ACP methyl ester carboxylesterase